MIKDTLKFILLCRFLIVYINFYKNRLGRIMIKDSLEFILNEYIPHSVHIFL